MCRDSLERNQKFFDYVNDSISKLSGSVAKIDSKADAIQVKLIENCIIFFQSKASQIFPIKFTERN